MEYKKLLFLIIAMIILNINLISCEDFGYNILPQKTFNNNTAFVNESAHWVTDSLGTLSDANSTQFNGDGGVLSIMESWLTSFINIWFGTKTTDDLPEGSTNLYGIWTNVSGTATYEGEINVTDNVNNISMYFEDGYLVIEG